MDNVIYSQMEGLILDTHFPDDEVMDFSLYPQFKLGGFQLAHFMTLIEEMKDFPLVAYRNVVSTAPLGFDSFIATKEIPEENNIIPPVEARYELDALTACFRLFQSGYVGWGISFFNERKSKHGGMFGSTLRDAGGGMAFLLKEANIPVLCKYVDKIFPTVLEMTKTNGELMFKFFIRGLNNTLRWEFRASLVDYFVSLEALFNRQKGKKSNNPLLMASVIGSNTADQRKKTYEKLKHIKDKRNMIVHGPYRNFDSDRLQDNCIFVENIIRNNLRKIVTYEALGLGYEAYLEDINKVISGDSEGLPGVKDLM